MSATLTSSRISLRCFDVSDYAFLSHHAGDEDIVRWANRSLPPCEQSAVQWVEQVQELAQTGEAYWYAIVEKESDTVMGAVNLREIDTRTMTGTVGFWLAREYRRQGFASEALSSILNFAFEELRLHRVIAAVHEPNTGSALLLAKAGFRLEGRSREAEVVNGLRCDVLWFGILRSEYSSS